MLNQSQQIALAIAPKFTALASIFGSSCLIVLTAKKLLRPLRPQRRSVFDEDNGGGRGSSSNRFDNTTCRLSSSSSVASVTSGSNSNKGTSGGSAASLSTRGSTYHRLVLGLSVGDLFASIAWFLTTWPIPADTENVYGAVGTVSKIH